MIFIVCTAPLMRMTPGKDDDGDDDDDDDGDVVMGFSGAVP